MSNDVSCGKCNIALEESSSLNPAERQPCPACGSTTRLYAKELNATIDLHSSLGYKGRRGGKSKPFRWGVVKDSLSIKIGQWMRLTRLFDKETDIYEEVVIDPDTGEVVHQIKEPLTKHQGHGSAKQKH